MKAEESLQLKVPDNLPIGIGLMIKGLLYKCRGNIMICTDMTKDQGVLIGKEDLNL